MKELRPLARALRHDVFSGKKKPTLGANRTARSGGRSSCGLALAGYINDPNQLTEVCSFIRFRVALHRSQSVGFFSTGSKAPRLIYYVEFSDAYELPIRKVVNTV